MSQVHPNVPGASQICPVLHTGIKALPGPAKLLLNAMAGECQALPCSPGTPGALPSVLGMDGDVGGHAHLGQVLAGRRRASDIYVSIQMHGSKPTLSSAQQHLKDKKKLQANHGPKLVIYFCLSVDKSLYKPLLHLPTVPGCALGSASLRPSVPWCLCHTPPQQGRAGSSGQGSGACCSPKSSVSVTAQPQQGWGRG